MRRQAKGRYIMAKIIKKIVKPGDQPTPTQVKEIEEASKHSIVFDEECPEFTIEELEEMRLAAIKKRAEQKKEVVAIRLSQSTINRAKSFGKGYTGFLSRLIENAINDKDIVSRSL